MNDLVVIVEGETEQTFVRNQLAAHLAVHGTNVWAVLPGRHRRHGGIRKWEVACQDIVRTLKEQRYCSTMVDYYALPNTWPGRDDSAALPWAKRATYVESQIHLEISKAMGQSFDPQFFIPYVQLHEFEALAFAGIKELTSVVAPLSRNSANSIEKKFERVLDEAGHPEAINDGYETCPSRRITSVVRAYNKRAHGPIVTSRIGLEALREKCGHFASWLDRLENMGSH